MPLAYFRLGSGTARPLRIEFAGALYHVTSRGDGQEAIHLDEVDREAFDAVLGEVCERFNRAVNAACQELKGSVTMN